MDLDRSTLATDSREQPISFTQFLWSSKPSSWHGFALEAHRVGPAGSLANFEVPQPLLGVCLSGSAQMSFRTRSHEDRAVMRPGRFILLRRGEQPRSIAWSGMRETLYIRLGARELARLLPEHERTEILPQYAATGEPALRLARCMHDEVRAGCPNGAVYAESLSLALASYLFGRFGATYSAPGEGSALSPAKMAALRDHVRAHLGNPLALVDLARMAGLSPHYFLQAFRKSFGVTPHQYVLGERIQEAMRLLKGDQLSISDIALGVGFSDQSHFTATFRRFAGTTPRRYRQAS